jgi:hypothetical protein
MYSHTIVPKQISAEKSYTARLSIDLSVQPVSTDMRAKLGGERREFGEFTEFRLLSTGPLCRITIA